MVGSVGTGSGSITQSTAGPPSQSSAIIGSGAPIIVVTCSSWSFSSAAFVPISG
jgi:hypothetical protein